MKKDETNRERFIRIAESRTQKIIDMLELLDLRPEDLHLVMTGRDAAESLVERADLVTEMKEIKHPYQKGIKAQKGIEF